MPTVGPRRAIRLRPQPNRYRIGIGLAEPDGT